MSRESGKPLVSICIPVYNGGELIAHALESAIRQSYDRLEIIVSDNGSPDNTEEVVRKYAARDQRIKYFRSPTNVGPTRNFRTAIEAATGEFVQILAHDDWLERNYVEEAVRQFEIHPEAGSVVPKTLSLELKNGKFDFVREVSMPPGVYSRADLIKTIHSSVASSMIIYSMVRRHILLEGIRFTSGFFDEPAADLKPEFRDFHRKGFGIDIVITLKILAGSKEAVFTDGTSYIKVDQEKGTGRTAGESVAMTTAAGILNNYLYFRLCHDYVYSADFPGERGSMRIAVGRDALGTLCLNYIKEGFARRFLKGFGRRNMSEFFAGYSSGEKAAVWAGLLPRIGMRIMRTFRRRLGKNGILPAGPEYFLSSEGRFTAE